MPYILSRCLTWLHTVTIPIRQHHFDFFYTGPIFTMMIWHFRNSIIWIYWNFSFLRSKRNENFFRMNERYSFLCKKHGFIGCGIIILWFYVMLFKCLVLECLSYMKLYEVMWSYMKLHIWSYMKLYEGLVLILIEKLEFNEMFRCHEQRCSESWWKEDHLVFAVSCEPKNE